LAVVAAAVGHQADLEAVAQATVSRCAERRFQVTNFISGEVETDHGWLLPYRKRTCSYRMNATASAAS
jgi:hypothetical protein